MTLNSQSLNLNARQILFKRLSTVQALAYTGPLGEIIIDANLKLLRVQDGVTAGGHLMMTSNVAANLQSQINSIKSNLDPAALDSLTEILANVNALLANNIESQLINSGFYANLTTTGNLVLDGSLLPKTHLAQDLGSATRSWRNLYISNATAYFGNSALTITNNGLQVFDANNRPMPLIGNVKFPDGSIQNTAVDQQVVANIFFLLSPNIAANLVGINNDVTNAISYFGNLANAAVTSVQANLQSQIDYIKTNIDPAAFDSLAEIVTAFQGVDANVIANISTIQTRVGNLESSSDRLVNGSANLILTGGANPYLTFPAITGGDQLGIQGSEVVSLSGTLALSSPTDIALNTNGANAGGIGSQGWNFGADGNLVLPAGGDILDSNGVSVLGGGASIGNLAVMGSRIYNTDGNIELTANDGVISQTWRFDPDGGIRTPNELLTIGGYTILTDNNNELDLSNSSDITIRSNVGGVALGANWGGIQSELKLEATGNITLPQGYLKPDPDNGSLIVEGPLYSDMVSLPGYPGSYATISNGIKIRTHKLVTNVNNDWNFSWDGTLYAPHDSSQSQVGALEWRAATGAASQIKYTPGYNHYSTVVPPGMMVYNYAGAGGFTVKADTGGFGANSSKFWVFNTSGNLSLPGNLVFADGTIQSTAYTGGGGGGAANTGNITFNNTTIQGVGDEYGSGGIYLSPDPSVTANLMYFRVRGGDNPTHLHFDTGNGSYYDQYFGDDAKYLKLAADGNISVGTSSRTWTFDTDGNLTLPQTAMNVSPAPVSWPGITFSDGSFQNTAYTGGGGAAATVDITNTNGLSTTYYPTFVESRTSGQYMRADVDLTYRTDDNLLRSGNIQVGHNIYGSYRSGISTAIQFRPNISIDKRFLLTVDYSGGTYLRSGMEMPGAEVDKAVTLSFPHTNSNAGYIYIQGSDTNATDFNDAFNIMMNSGNVKISAISFAGGNKVWKFDTAGGLTFPDTTTQSTAWTGNTTRLRNASNQTLTWNSDYSLTSSGTGLINVKSNSLVQLSYVGSNPAGEVSGAEIQIAGGPSATSGVVVSTTTSVGTKSWLFNGNGNIKFPDNSIQSTAWTGAAASVQSLPPASPVTGQLYYDTDDGRTYIYTGSAWIDSNPAGAGSGAQLDEGFGNLTAATGVVTHDCTTNRLFYHTSISANFTANFTNLNLSAGRAASITLVLVQGATARMVTAVQIAGVAQTITWQGASSAPAGNASRTDAVTFSILNVSGTYTVLGMMTSFGGV